MWKVLALTKLAGALLHQRNIRQCSWVGINEPKEDGIIKVQRVLLPWHYIKVAPLIVTSKWYKALKFVLYLLSQSCTTIKEYDHTILRVVWNGDVRLMRPTSREVCRRWFFTIDGIECQTPAAIDTQLYVNDREDNDHRPAYCESAYYVRLEHNCKGWGAIQFRSLRWSFVLSENVSSSPPNCKS